MTHLQKAMPVQLLSTRMSRGYPIMSLAVSHKLSNSRNRGSPPSGVPPYLRCGKWRTGWCSEGGRGTGGNGKNISSSPVLAVGWRALRCGLHIRTAAATASQRRTGEVREGKEAAMSAAVQGGYDSISPDLVELRSDRWGAKPSCLSRTLGVRFCPVSWGGQYLCGLWVKAASAVCLFVSCSEWGEQLQLITEIEQWDMTHCDEQQHELDES